MQLTHKNIVLIAIDRSSHIFPFKGMSPSCNQEGNATSFKGWLQLEVSCVKITLVPNIAYLV